MTKIYAPDERASGESYIGPHVLTFTNGVADFDGALSDGARSYMESIGYGIGTKPTSTVVDEPVRVDSRDVTTALVGTDLRDAAVDPKPEDFMAPVNAGQADPQGPTVVSPTIHASGVKVVVPGPVGTVGEDADGKPVVEKDTDAQDQRESAFAEATLVEQTPVPEATAEAAKVDPINEDAQRADDGEFDPSKHSVADVKAHLETADDEERARVLAAEADGKDRPTLRQDT